MDLARVRVAPVSHGTSPDEGITSGSRSIAGLRLGAAPGVRAGPATCCSPPPRTGSGAGPAALSVTDGEILARRRPTGLSYWSLADRRARWIARPADPVAVPAAGAAVVVAGRSAARLDIPDKVTGRPRFLHDLVLPGMLFGRVVRPPVRRRPSCSRRPADLPARRDVTRHATARSSAWWPRPTAAARAGGAAARPRAARWKVTPVRCPTSDDLRAFLLAAPAETLAVVRAARRRPPPPRRPAP